MQIHFVVYKWSLLVNLTYYYEEVLPTFLYLWALFCIYGVTQPER
jgi:hypothetical protein